MKQFLTSFLFLVVSCVGMAPMLAPAQVQTCGPGLNCVSASFRAPPQSRASFPACTNSVSGQMRFNGDAGVPYVCAAGRWAPASGWQQVDDANPYSAAPRFAPLTAGVPSVPYTVQGYADYSGLTFWDDSLVTLYGGSTGVEIHADNPSALDPTASGTVTVYPGAIYFIASDDSAGVKTMTLSPSGVYLNADAPVSGFPEAQVWYDGGNPLEPGNTYVQVMPFAGAQKNDICLIQQAVDARSNSNRLITHCAADSGGDRVIVSYFNPGAGNANPTCAFSNPDCGYRVRLIQRH